MEPSLTILVSIMSSSVVAAGISFLTNLKLEQQKAKLAQVSNEQAKRRQLYDDLSTFIEDVFGGGETHTKAGLSLATNKLFAKLALYAPDEVYFTVRDTIVDKGTVLGREAKPRIYCALRKSLFGHDTKMEFQDFVPHIEAQHISEEQVKNDLRDRQIENQTSRRHLQ